MNLPSFPTDNLYKFMAIAGLALTAYSMILPTIQLRELEIQTARLRTEVAILDIESRELKKLMNAATPANADVVRSSDVELTKREAEAKGKLEEQKMLLRFVNNLLTMAWIEGTVGTLVSAIGFVFWYNRIQKPQDLLLKRQIDNSEAESKTVESTSPSPPPSDAR